MPFGIAAVVLAGFSAWLGLRWPPALIPAILFALSALLLIALALRPVIQLDDSCLRIGKRRIAWSEIRRVDRTGWVCPLALRLTLFEDRRIVLLYPGDLDSCNSLLRSVRRLSRDALIDGVPYRQFWGEVLGPGAERKQSSGPRYRVLRPEDEAEVERLYQRLKSVGNLDQKSTDEK
ncbi:MAG: hypothetical protein IT158_19705 [Bryobacterales bacterium]|nr:hypothetical protein [Bryobacterales bacterium]